MKKPLPFMTAKELRAIRADLEKTQAEMAEAMGVDIRSYQRWESEERTIPGPAVLLARLLHRQNKG